MIDQAPHDTNRPAVFGSSSSPAPSPLLEPGAPRFTSRLQKGGALLGDMRQLVCHWHRFSPGDSPARFVKDLLPKATLARANDTYSRAFLPRFIAGSPKEAWKLCAELETTLPPIEIVRSFYYWVTARAEPLLYYYATDELYQQMRAGIRTVHSTELSGWIRQTREPTCGAWSNSVSIKVAQGILATLRDFGVLTGSAKKTISAANLPLESFCLIAFCLRVVLADSQALMEHPDWRLYLLSPSLVERLLLEAHQHGWLHYQTAGRVARLEFPDLSFDDYVRRVLSR